MISNNIYQKDFKKSLYLERVNNYNLNPLTNKKGVSVSDIVNYFFSRKITESGSISEKERKKQILGLLFHRIAELMCLKKNFDINFFLSCVKKSIKETILDKEKCDEMFVSLHTIYKTLHFFFIIKSKSWILKDVEYTVFKENLLNNINLFGKIDIIFEEKNKINFSQNINLFFNKEKMSSSIINHEILEDTNFFLQDEHQNNTNSNLIHVKNDFYLSPFKKNIIIIDWKSSATNIFKEIQGSPTFISPFLTNNYYTRWILQLNLYAYLLSETQDEKYQNINIKHLFIFLINSVSLKEHLIPIPKIKKEFILSLITNCNFF